MKMWAATIYWSKISLFFLYRSGKTTAFLSIMVVSAVAALIFLSALTVGVHDAMLRNTVGLFTGHITGYNIHEKISADALQGKEPVTVLKRQFLPGVLDHGEKIHSLTLCLLDTEKEATVTAFHRKINSGRYPHMGSGEILLSSAIAEELRAKVGDQVGFSVRAGGNRVVLTVSGNYDTSMDSFDWKTAFAPLGQASSQQAGWTAAVFLPPGIATDEALAKLRDTWKGQITFESWETTMPDLRQLIDLEYISMGIVILLVFAVVAIGISCSFIIFILRNIREYGIMKAMGVTNGELSLLILTKITMMNGVACLAGLLLGCVSVWFTNSLGGIDISTFTSHNQYFSVSGVIIPRLTLFSLCTPPATAMFFSIIASLWPAMMLARKRTAEILRSL